MVDIWLMYGGYMSELKDSTLLRILFRMKDTRETHPSVYFYLDVQAAIPGRIAQI